MTASSFDTASSFGPTALREAHGVASALVAGIRDDQWQAPTPCSGWTVRDVVNHLVAGNHLFADILAGRPQPPVEELRRRFGEDHLGDDPAGALEASADALERAFAAPGAMERSVAVPAGTVPGAVAVHLRIVEALVPGWDVARATEQAAVVPENLAEQELQFTHRMLPQVPAREHGPFAPSQPVAPDAPAIDRLAALLGRPVDWSAPTR